MSLCPRQCGENVTRFVHLRADKAKIAASRRSGFPGGISATYNTITRNISSAASSMSRGSQQIWLCPLLCLATARKPPWGSSLAPSQHLPVEWTSPVSLTWPGAEQGELSQSCRRWLKETPHLSLHTWSWQETSLQCPRARSGWQVPKKVSGATLSFIAWHGGTRATRL